jgi:hypothetical protein
MSHIKYGDDLEISEYVGKKDRDRERQAETKRQRQIDKGLVFGK